MEAMILTIIPLLLFNGNELVFPAVRECITSDRKDL